jgi:hypothetical protein
VGAGEVKVRRAVLGAAVLAGVAALAGGYLRACAGPRPIVVGARAEWLLVGVRAIATVRNAGSEGQVEVVFRITDAEGRTYTSEESAELRSGEQVEVSTWINAPEAKYRVEAEAEYPPR